MTPHLWVRAEQRPHEERVGVTPEGVAALVKAGIRVTVEESHVRAIPIDGYAKAGAEIVAENLWPKAPQDAIIFGLKELPDDGTPLPHRHIMFGHAFKGQPAGQGLLRRFRDGGGRLSGGGRKLARVTGVAPARSVPLQWGLGFAGILALTGVACSLASSTMRRVSAGVAGAAAVAAFALPFKLNIVFAIAVAVALSLLLERPAPPDRRGAA